MSRENETELVAADSAEEAASDVAPVVGGEGDDAIGAARAGAEAENPAVAADGEEADEKRGKELHREFVGMLFALATAELAIQTATVVNSGLDWRECLPAYFHLALGFAVVATSWVGWGCSKSSLSNINSVFSGDFIELALDVWLVAVYFFVAKGVELPSKDASGNLVVTPSFANEVWWILVIFVTYAVWDVWTKLIVGPRKDKKTDRLLFVQRGWASAACAALAYLAFQFLSTTSTPDGTQVILGDLSLLSLVFLFRAMKTQNLFQLRWNWCLIGMFLSLFLATLAGASKTMRIGPSLHNAVSNLVP